MKNSKQTIQKNLIKLCTFCYMFKEYSQIHLLPYSMAAQSEYRTDMTVTKHQVVLTESQEKQTNKSEILHLEILPTPEK